MTTKEAVALLERYSNYDGMGIPNLAGCKEASRVAVDALKEAYPELAESEDERIRKWLLDYAIEMIAGLESDISLSTYDGIKGHDPEAEAELAKWQKARAYLEKQKENPKSADSIPPDCTLDVKCEDRWHKVTDSLPDNGRLVLAKDCLGNVLLARYDGENWEVNVYDNEDHYCHNSISKWCEIPSEKQKEQKPSHKFNVGDTIHCKYDDREFTIKSVDLANEVYKYTKEGCGNDIDYADENFELVEQKPEWSDEDERMQNALWNLLHLHYAQDNAQTLVGIEAGKFRSWLKSLRPDSYKNCNSRWKPSEEQIEALNSLLCQGDFSYIGQAQTLQSLYIDLMKL